MLFKLSAKEGTTKFINLDKRYQTNEAYRAKRTRSAVPAAQARAWTGLRQVGRVA